MAGRQWAKDTEVGRNMDERIGWRDAGLGRGPAASAGTCGGMAKSG